MERRRFVNDSSNPREVASFCNIDWIKQANIKTDYEHYDERLLIPL